MRTIKPMEKHVWALIPARGGSKSIPLKNLVQLGTRPLIDYVISAARASKRITRIICSTEDERIASRCEDMGVEVHHRPIHLAQDDTAVKDVLIHMLKDIVEREGRMPDFLPILQPTSPFVLPEHIDRCIDLMERDHDCDSSQTITTLAHNFHAYNQRKITAGYVAFCFPLERRICFNKQLKPKHYIFGNLVITRAQTLLEKNEIFGDRSIPLEIPPWYALDVDGREDLELAEWALNTSKVVLPHMDEGI